MHRAICSPEPNKLDLGHFGLGPRLLGVWAPASAQLNGLSGSAALHITVQHAATRYPDAQRAQTSAVLRNSVACVACLQPVRHEAPTRRAYGTTRLRATRSEAYDIRATRVLRSPYNGK